MQLINISHIPVEIIFPIFIDQIDRWHVNDIIHELSRIFGINTTLKNIDLIILYMIEKDHLSCLPWILKNEKRCDKYLETFDRHLLNKLKVFPVSYELLLQVVDLICRLEHDDLVLKYVSQTGKFFVYLPEDYKTRLCIMGAKYGRVDLVNQFMYNEDGVNLNVNRCNISFQIALKQGKHKVYEMIYAKAPYIIDWTRSEYEYACAEDHELQLGSCVQKSSLRFLLQHDPRVWHISQKYKKIYANESTTHFYRVRKTLRSSECVSTRCLANYNPDYDYE